MSKLIYPVAYGTPAKYGIRFSRLDTPKEVKMGNAHLLIDGFCWGCGIFMPSDEQPCFARNVLSMVTWGQRPEQTVGFLRNLTQNDTLPDTIELPCIDYSESLTYLTKKNARLREVENGRIVTDVLVCRARWQTINSRATAKTRHYYLFKDIEVTRLISHINFFQDVAKAKKVSYLREDNIIGDKLPYYSYSAVFPHVAKLSNGRSIIVYRPMSGYRGNFYGEFKERCRSKLHKVKEAGRDSIYLDKFDYMCFVNSDNRGRGIDTPPTAE